MALETLLYVLTEEADELDGFVAWVGPAEAPPDVGFGVTCRELVPGWYRLSAGGRLAVRCCPELKRRLNRLPAFGLFRGVVLNRGLPGADPAPSGFIPLPALGTHPTLAAFGDGPGALDVDAAWAYVRLGFRRAPYPWKQIMLPAPLLRALCPAGWPMQLGPALSYSLRAYTPKPGTRLHAVAGRATSPLLAVREILAAVALPQQLDTDFEMARCELREATQAAPSRGQPVPGLDGLVMTAMTTSRTHPGDGAEPQ